jgi:hypothetical protein
MAGSREGGSAEVCRVGMGAVLVGLLEALPPAPPSPLIRCGPLAL